MKTDNNSQRDSALLDLLSGLLRGETAAPLETLDHDAVDRLLHLCAVHGIEPLIYAELERQPRLQAPALEALEQALEPKIQSLAAAELLKKVAIVRLLQQFAASQIPVTVLKGAALGYTLYPQPYYRTRGDLDLIISEQDREAVDALLLNEGYQRLDVNHALFSFQISYIKPQPDIPTDPVDLHWKLNDRSLFANLLSPEQLFQASEPAPSLSPHARTLSRVYAMLHACIHRAASFTTHYFVVGEDIITPDRLIWLYDIHLLAQTFTPADWERLCDLADAHRLRAVCQDALLATQHRLDTPIPNSAMQRLTAPGPPEPSAAYLRLGLANRIFTDVRAQPNWRARVKLVASYALPPAEFMRRKYENTNWPLPALYLLYLGQGIRKLLLT